MDTEQTKDRVEELQQELKNLNIKYKDAVAGCQLWKIKFELVESFYDDLLEKIVDKL